MLEVDKKSENVVDLRLWKIGSGNGGAMTFDWTRLTIDNCYLGKERVRLV